MSNCSCSCGNFSSSLVSGSCPPAVIGSMWDEIEIAQIVEAAEILLWGQPYTLPQQDLSIETKWQSNAISKTYIASFKNALCYILCSADLLSHNFLLISPV